MLNKPQIRSMLSKLILLFVIIFGIGSLIASGTIQTPSAPRAPIIEAPTKNANLPTRLPNEEISTVFFSRSDLLQEVDIRRPNFAYNTYPDLFIASRYSFQISINANELFNSQFSVFDESNIALQKTAVERVNADINKLPGSPGWIPRPTYPDSSAVYSFTVTDTCNGVPKYGRPYQCPTSSVSSLALVLTIKPITARLIHGTTFTYHLEWKNSLGAARRTIKAVYVEPGRCKITSLLAGLDSATAYETRTVNWATQDCHSISLAWIQAGIFGSGTSGVLQTLFETTVSPPDTASQHIIDGALPIVIPPVYRSSLQMWASDAMGESTKNVKTFTVAPCSISLTDPNCEARCKQIPRPSGCPPPVSELPKVCGGSTPDGQPLMWSFSVLCNWGGGIAKVETASELTCTEAEARAGLSNRLLPNCGIVKLTGPGLPPPGETGSPMCSQPGQTVKEYKFCLQCGTAPTPSTAAGSGCNAFEAEQDAKYKASPTTFCQKVGMDGPCP